MGRLTDFTHILRMGRNLSYTPEPEKMTPDLGLALIP